MCCCSSASTRFTGTHRALPAQYWGTVLTAATFLHTCSLMLDHPVFAYVRARILADRHCLDRSLLERCVTLLAERDILAGDFAAALALLGAFTDLDISLVRGMLELLQGRVPEARQAFDQALRKVGKGKTAQTDHADTFPGILHALLLAQSEEPQDRQQARAWADRFAANRREVSTYHDAYRLLGALLSWHGVMRLRPDIVTPFHYHEGALVLLGTLMLQLLYWFYASQTKAVKNHKQTVFR
jgi:hypothetical protein